MVGHGKAEKMVDVVMSSANAFQSHTVWEEEFTSVYGA